MRPTVADLLRTAEPKPNPSPSPPQGPFKSSMHSDTYHPPVEWGVGGLENQVHPDRNRYSFFWAL